MERLLSSRGDYEVYLELRLNKKIVKIDWDIAAN